MIKEQLDLFKKPEEKPVKEEKRTDFLSGKMGSEKIVNEKENPEKVYALSASVDTGLIGESTVKLYIKKNNLKDAQESFKAYIFSNYKTSIEDRDIQHEETLTPEENELRLKKEEASKARYKD